MKFVIRSLLLAAYTLGLVCVSVAQKDDSNKLWILIDNVNLLVCQGPSNQFSLTKEDVSVKDAQGRSVEILEAPGEYFLSFDRIRVSRPMPNIGGRLAATLQLPLVSSGFVRLDLPYQLIPQKTLLEGSTCDNESGVVYDQADKREYCRYCDLCSTSGHVEKKLSSGDLGHVYAPKLGTEAEGSFTRVCRQIDATTYSLRRSVLLPDKKELEDEANSRYKGTLEGAAQQKLKVGKGKLQVFLNLDSSTLPPVDANQWYKENRTCACCAKDDLGNSKCRPTLAEQLLGKKPGTCPRCNNGYVLVCLRGTQTRVGCYVVEYTFQVTDKRQDVEQFMKLLAARQGKTVQSGGSGSEAKSGGAKVDADGKAASGAGGQTGAAGGQTSGQTGGQTGGQTSGQASGQTGTAASKTGGAGGQTGGAGGQTGGAGGQTGGAGGQTGGAGGQTGGAGGQTGVAGGQTGAAGGQSPGGGAKPCESCDTDKCKRLMNQNFLSYCGTMDRKVGAGRRYCCNQCPSVCSQ